MPTEPRGRCSRRILGEAPPCRSGAHGQSGRVHRYYVSAPLQQGRRATPNPNAVRRVAAGELERLLRDELALRMRVPAETTLTDLTKAIHRIEIEAECVRVIVDGAALTKAAIVSTPSMRTRSAVWAWR